MGAPDGLREVLSVVLPRPEAGNWRPDVIGVDKLSLQAGCDGWPLINAHRVTEEMCAALRADRPGQAGNFVFEDLVVMAREMVPPGLDGLAEALATGDSGCPGRQLDHEDGSMPCSLGPNCPGAALPHAGRSHCREVGGRIFLL
ncbi:hypothetical protein AB0D11_44635 [Streptomyces monashensis]|uniref:hypothetical protein n=1 Tax=Streptomyces monashensis TaxID=1678012 RepID=UPI00340FE908